MSVSPASDLLQEGLALHRRGAVDEAAARYAEVLRADPANADALYYLALISCQHGRFEEGAELARKSLASDPNQARSHVILGRALHALGRTTTPWQVSTAPSRWRLSWRRRTPIAPTF